MRSKAYRDGFSNPCIVIQRTNASNQPLLLEAVKKTQ